MRITSRTGSTRRILGFWKSQWVELRTRHRTRRLTFACSPRPRAGVARMGGRWKSQNRKNVYLSPYVEEPLNSKVIKSFVPELRSRKCFSCFEIPMFYLYEHSMYVSHIAMSWLWYNETTTQKMFKNVYWTRFPNLQSENNPWRIDMPIKSIPQWSPRDLPVFENIEIQVIPCKKIPTDTQVYPM